MIRLRLLPLDSYDSVYNMALDRLLLRRVAEGKSPATFRFYRWNHPTLSLGHGQKDLDLNLNSSSMTERIILVKRPTGGAVAVHGRDISYSLTTPVPNELLPARPRACYQVIHEAIATAIQSLGCPVECAPDHSRADYRTNIYCGLTHNPYDIICQGRKLVGGAQRLTSHAFLQHGFILMDEDFGWVREALGEEGSRIARACISLAEILSPRMPPDDGMLCRIILDTLSQRMNIEFEPSVLLKDEQTELEEWMESHSDIAIEKIKHKT